MWRFTKLINDGCDILVAIYELHYNILSNLFREDKRHGVCGGKMKPHGVCSGKKKPMVCGGKINHMVCVVGR